LFLSIGSLPPEIFYQSKLFCSQCYSLFPQIEYDIQYIFHTLLCIMYRGFRKLMLKCDILSPEALATPNTHQHFPVDNLKWTRKYIKQIFHIKCNFHLLICSKLYFRGSSIGHLTIQQYLVKVVHFSILWGLFSRGCVKKNFHLRFLRTRFTNEISCSKPGPQELYSFRLLYTLIYMLSHFVHKFVIN
jgi:hypothetical protein